MALATNEGPGTVKAVSKVAASSDPEIEQRIADNMWEPIYPDLMPDWTDLLPLPIGERAGERGGNLLPNRVDVLVAPDLVIRRDQRRRQMPGQRHEHAVRRVGMKSAGQTGGLYRDLVIHRHELQRFNAAGLAEPILNIDAQQQPAFLHQQGDLPGRYRRNDDKPVRSRRLTADRVSCRARKLRAAVHPPDEHVGVEHDHGLATTSQFSVATGSVGSV